MVAGRKLHQLHRAQARVPSPSPTPPNEPEPTPGDRLGPSPSVAPMFPPVASFNTEQIYICNRDGYDLKPLTAREGLIYFYFAWAPDGHALVALACKEDEWNARERQYKLPAGRPRLIAPDGSERLLDDALTERCRCGRRMLRRSRRLSILMWRFTMRAEKRRRRRVYRSAIS